MAYVTPTPADLKTRFPAFAGVADAAILLPAVNKTKGEVIALFFAAIKRARGL